MLAVYAAAEAALTFLKHFDLFVLMHRFKDPGRLPDKLQLDDSESLPSETPLLKIKLLAFNGIFSVFIRIAQRRTAHYSPLEIFSRSIGLSGFAIFRSHEFHNQAPQTNTDHRI